jgi:hypothetical protein
MKVPVDSLGAADPAFMFCCPSPEGMGVLSGKYSLTRVSEEVAFFLWILEELACDLRKGSPGVDVRLEKVLGVAG